MQRSIMSFFHPKKEGKAKKPEKETSSREIEPPPKVALKERNGEVPENDSPVKRPGRKAARVLGSEGEEEDEALTPSKGQKPAPGSPQVSPPSPVTFPEGSPPLSNTSPAGLSPTGIPKRRTARKQLPKRPIQDILEEQNEDEDREAKRKKEEETPTESLTEPELAQKEEAEGDRPTTPAEHLETSPAEPPTDSTSEPEVAGKQEAREGDQAKPPPRAPKTVSSFFAPRKPATKKEGKEEGPGAPRKEEAKGPLDPPGYNPAKNNYHPVDDACWKPGQKVPYLAVARTFEKIEEVSARLRMVETLSNLLRSVVALSPPDLLPILYLSLNRLGPPQQGLELGVGDGVLLKAVAQATGKQGVWWPLERRGLRGRRGRGGERVRDGRGDWRWGRQRMDDGTDWWGAGSGEGGPAAGGGAGGGAAGLGGGAEKTVWREQVPREAADVGRTTWAGPPGLRVHVGEPARGRVGPLGTRGPVRPPQPRLPAPQGRQLESVKAEAAEKGDMGLVAENSRSTQRLMLPPPALTAAGVFAKFRDIAGLAGSASTAKKIDVIKGLFVACRHSEARFIASEVPDLDRIIPVLLEHGLEHLPEHCRLSPGVPLKPMLAHPTRGVSEILKRFEEAAFTCEYKYDGQRAQIHVLEGGEVKIFSRNQEDNTGKYPDIISRIPKIKLPSVTSFILDTEAVAWDREKKQIQPFQMLTTRKRKEVDAADIQVQVCLYAFDLIYLNGESLVREPLSRRRQLLRENFVQTEGEFVFATSLDTKDTDQIAEFLEQSVKDSCEGLMVKTLDVDATYEIAKRSHNWLKLKKDYLDGVGDTLDLVVIGAYLGRGKRAGRYGGFLLAAYDEESEELQAICKLGTGFSDEELEDHFHSLQALVLPTPRSYVRADGAVAPDHWLDPSAVWEVKCADLSLSPIYPAARGLVDSEKGISLRFPRFIRVREDKKPEEATTSAQVASLFKKQSQIQNQQGADLDSDPEDFY
uniref:DNA ligase n=1 Tax=Panthera leo TaxID=9689 RepID=A0A8C8WZN7_PANLE